MSGGALDASVTLDDVFAVVVAKRVPLAPELAGYLVLEIAEHADPKGGDLEPRSVFVGEEGTVALVKPKREGATGDAEASIRSALARLLEASGSQTPALAAASKRSSGGGLAMLAEELEAALIPVNRAAGRRALARLAREVRRVTLGVGRNALPSTTGEAAGAAAAPAASRRGSSPAHQAAPAPAPAPPAPPPEPTPPPPSVRPPSPSFSREEATTTARGQIPDEILRQATPPAIDASELPTMQFEPAAHRTPSPSQADVDSLIDQFAVSGTTSEQHHARELKAMVGLEPTPPPPPEIARRMETREVEVGGGEDVEALLSMGNEGSGRPPAPEPAPDTRRPSARGRTASPRPQPRQPTPERDSDPRQLPTGPSEIRKRASMPSLPRANQRRGSGWVMIVALVVVAAGAYAVWRLRPGIGGDPVAVGPVPASASASASAAAQCKGSLIVTDVPAHAEVLLRAGQAPVDMPNMPVGTRLEFVATAEGYAPKRAVVPAGASWDTGADGKARFEAAVQLDKSKAHPGTNDPWPAGEAGSAVGGEGPPGTVHVVATPRGAEIWMLVAIGPEARIDQLHCTQDFDVLLAGPTTYRKRLHVAASDFVLEDNPAGTAPTPPGKLPTRVARISGK
jgi:hypothetical protein